MINSDSKFVASMDVKALFPSLKTEQCATAVSEVILNSKLKLEGFNYKELGVFLRKHLSTKEIAVKNHLINLIPTEKKKCKNN